MADPVTLTRRFSDAAEVRAELHANLLAGSLWIPHPEAARSLEPRQSVEVMLVLPDGRVLDGIKGRVFCLSPDGVAVFVEDMPAAALAVLSEEPQEPQEPQAAPEPEPEPEPEPPPQEQDIVLRGDDPFAAAFPTAPLPTDPPSFDGESLPPEKSSNAIDPDRIPSPPAPEEWFSPPAGDESPIPQVRAEGDERPVVKVGVTPGPASFMQAWENTTASGLHTANVPELESPDAEMPVLEPQPPETFDIAPKGQRSLTPPPATIEEEPEAPAPPPPAPPAPPPNEPARAASEDLLAQLEAARTEADFPALRNTEEPVVASLHSSEDLWSDGDEALPAQKEASAPEPEAPAAAPAPTAGAPAALVMPFASLVDFKKEYESNIRRGGVLVPSAERPPIRSVVEVVFSLMQGKREVRLRGECVFHAPTGVGVQITEIPVAVRREIEGLLAAATPVPESTEPGKPAPAAAPAAPAPETAAPIAEPSAPTARPSAQAALQSPPAGRRLEGDLVELLREAEVEGETRADGNVGAKASWLKVLAALQQERSTGILQALRKGETKSFFVFQGRILDAMGQPSRDDESLARVAKKQNLLKPQVQKAFERAMENATDEVATAQTSGAFTPAELDKARRWQALERCAEVFGWEKGRFRFDPDGDRKWARPTTGVPVGHVILHGVRSYIRASGEDLARVLRTAIDRIPKVVTNSGFEPAKVGMSDKELRFWSDLDGVRSIRVLLTITPLPVSHTYRLLFALLRLGVLRLETAAGKTVVRDDRVKSLEARLAEMKTRDPFGVLGVSWMAALPQVQAGFEAIRKELDADLKSGATGIADLARQVFAKADDAYKTLSNDRQRRVARLKVVEDPSRIESAAEMLSEKAGLLSMRGEKAEAIAAMQMALDMAPDNPQIQAAAGRILRGDGHAATR